MNASLHRIRLDTEAGTQVHDLLKLGEFEHWIVLGWLTCGATRGPKRAIRLEGLPFIPSGIGEADFTVTVPLPDQLLIGDGSPVFRGRVVDVIDSDSPRAARLQIPAWLVVEHAYQQQRRSVQAQDQRDGRHLMDPRRRALRVNDAAENAGQAAQHVGPE